jgi:hypothetical protein
MYENLWKTLFSSENAKMADEFDNERDESQ